MVNNFKIKVNNVEIEEIDFRNKVISNLTEGENTIVIEAYNGATLIDTKTITGTKTATATLDEDTEIAITAAGLPQNDNASIYTGLTNNQVITIINDSIVAYKNAAIWDKIKLEYMMIGGTANSHRVNYKSPASYEMLWFGGWIHNNLGSKANGVDAYGNSQASFRGIVGSTAGGLTVTVNSANIPVNNFGTIYDFGAKSSDSLRIGLTSMSGNAGVNLNMKAAYDDLIVNTDIPSATVRGVMTIKRDLGTNNASVFRNGAKISTTAIPNATIGTLNLITLGGTNRTGSVASPNPEANKFSNQRYGQAGAHEGLTEAETLVYHSIIEAREVALGRKTW